MSENADSAEAADGKRKASEKKKTVVKTASKVAEPSLNMKELEQLAELVSEHGFTDFEFENENIRVRLSKNPTPQMVQAIQPFQPFQNVPANFPVVQQNPETKTESKVESSAEESEASSDENLHKIISPIVGTFYSSPAPDKDPYIGEGSKVSDSTVVCIVEAMKLMNEIQAEISGEIVKIYVENGQPVEYGQPLFGVKK